MSRFAFVFPGQGSQSVGMLDAWGDHPVVLRDPPGSVRCARRGCRSPDPRGPQGGARADHQHPAGDAGRRGRRLARLAGRGRPLPARGRGPLARRVFGAGRRRRADAGAGRAAGALSAPRPCRRPCRSAPAPWRPSWAGTRGVRACAEARGAVRRRQRRGGRGRQLQRSRQTVIAGSKAAVEKACEVLKSRWRQARAAAAGVGAVPLSLMKPAAERLQRKSWPRPFRRAADPGAQQHRRGGRDRSIASATRSIARPSARCAGSRRATEGKGAASATSSNAARQGADRHVKRIDA